MNEIEIFEPNDFHHHFRDGDVLKDIVPIVSNTFKYILAMPNIQPPVTTIQSAQEYYQRICQHIPSSKKDVHILMTLYLTDNTCPEEIINAKHSGLVYGCKLYPSGATTNSQHGVTSIEKLNDVFHTMQKIGMPLLIHGEVTDPEIDIFDREYVFIEKILRPICKTFPDLKIVMEHITTKQAVEFVLESGNNVAATITVHHLLYNRNALFQGGICPHMYCLPILKREEHRLALLHAATSGNSKFFLGTDSAPHAVNNKESSCGCAGIFTSHAALELCTEVFASVNQLSKLEGFCSVFGATFYNLPRNNRKIKLQRQAWKIPLFYTFGNSFVKPLCAGETVQWKIRQIEE